MGLDDVSVTLSVPDPITTNSTYTTTSTLLVPDPIKNDITTKSDIGMKSDLTLDVKPLETTIDVKPLVVASPISVTRSMSGGYLRPGSATRTGITSASRSSAPRCSA